MVDIKKFRQLDCEIYEEFWFCEVPSGGEVTPAAKEIDPLVFSNSPDWGPAFPNARGLCRDLSA